MHNIVRPRGTPPLGGKKMQSIVTVLSLMFWVVFSICMVINPSSMKINDKNVENPFLRFVGGVVAIPVLGVIFYILGFAGKFLLLPMIWVFHQ